MSLHNKPLTELERQGLLANGLSTDKASQLSDAFRLGVAWALDNSDNTEVQITSSKIVVEVTGRLQGRANVHLNAAKQTNDEKKKQAHLMAYHDMQSLSKDLAQATNNPEFAQTNAAFMWAISE